MYRLIIIFYSFHIIYFILFYYLFYFCSIYTTFLNAAFAYHLKVFVYKQSMHLSKIA